MAQVKHLFAIQCCLRRGGTYKFKAYDSLGNSISVNACNSGNDVEAFVKSAGEGSVIVADEYASGEIINNAEAMRAIQFGNIYTILVLREFTNKVDIGINSVYELCMDDAGMLRNKQCH